MRIDNNFTRKKVVILGRRVKLQRVSFFFFFFFREGVGSVRLSDFSILEYLDSFTWLLRLGQKLRWISQLRSKRNKLPPFGDLFPWWEIFRRAKYNLKSREFVFEPFILGFLFLGSTMRKIKRYYYRNDALLI